MIEFKDFGEEMTYKDAVVFLDKEGYRLLTLDEWFCVRRSFPKNWCWLQKPKETFAQPVARGSGDGVYLWRLGAYDDYDLDASAPRWVVGLKK